MANSTLKFQPLIPERWNDFERLFGTNGACDGCWCMWWRLKKSDYSKRRGEQNKRAFRKIVSSGEVPGLIAYQNGEPIGWCSFGPRERFSVLDRSRALARLDDQPVWSVVCFFIARGYRKKGITEALLRSAVAYAKKNRAKIMEGYPVEPAGRARDEAAYTGFKSIFVRCGFQEVIHRTGTRRTIMRRPL